MNPWNISVLSDETICNGGFGCLFIKINHIGNGWPFLAIFVASYMILTISMIKNGNDTLKSFTASTFIMFLIAIVAYVVQISNEIYLVNERLLLIIIIILAVISAIVVYKGRQ